MRQLRYARERWPLAEPFIVSFGTFTEIETVYVEISEGAFAGRGEAAGVFFHGEAPSTIMASIETVRNAIENGATRQQLQAVLPPGGARNALDCALWELEARSTGVTVSALTGIETVPLSIVATVSLGSPEVMAVQAAKLSAFATLKLKLGAHDPGACIAAVRAIRPDARLIADVNGAWTVAQLNAVAPECADLGVVMIEQPCALGEDDGLVQSECPVLLCADESCCTTDDLDALCGRYGMINIKLDKTGGLTEALALADAAEKRGFGLMVGNMMGTVIAMAPASLIAARCKFIDLDGPFLLAEDRPPGMILNGDLFQPLVPSAWG